MNEPTREKMIADIVSWLEQGESITFEIAPEYEYDSGRVQRHKGDTVTVKAFVPVKAKV